MVIKKKIIKTYQHTFNVENPDLVAIFISARCKSKKQIQLKTDEDLRVEINKASFREIPPQKISNYSIFHPVLMAQN